MKNVLTSLFKSIFIPLGLIAEPLLTVQLFKRKCMELKNDCFDKIKQANSWYHEISGKFCLLIEKVSKAIENEAKEQKRCNLWQLLGTLFENLLEIFLAGKPKISWGVVIRNSWRKSCEETGEETGR